MAEDNLISICFKKKSNSDIKSKPIEYEKYDDKDQLIETGSIVSDDENRQSEDSKPIFDLSSRSSIDAFMKQYPLKYRRTFNIFTQRHVFSDYIATYQFEDMLDDFYLNILDWSSRNIIASACVDGIKLLIPDIENQKVSFTRELNTLNSQDNYESPMKSRTLNGYTSCKFNKEGNILAVGTLDGSVELWDVELNKMTTKFNSHVQRVGVLDWVPDNGGTLLSSASRDKMIYIMDIRTPGHIIKWKRHKQEVCGLAWKPIHSQLSLDQINTTPFHSSVIDTYDSDSRYDDEVCFGDADFTSTIAHRETVLASQRRRISLQESRNAIYKALKNACNFTDNYQNTRALLASGGNDNKVFVWELGYNIPTLRLNEHTAAVKGIAWAPINYPILATGSGTNDRNIRIWDTNRKVSISRCESESQVCNLIWSSKSLEIISTHGYTLNQVNVWDVYQHSDSPNSLRFRKLSTLTGHSCRALYMCVSSDHKYIATASGEGKLYIWDLFNGCDY